MTDTLVLTDINVIVSVFGEEDRTTTFAELIEGEDHDPATIADDDLLRMVAVNMFDTTVEELSRIVTGNENAELKVGRPQTNTILVRGATVLGNDIPENLIKLASNELLNCIDKSDELSGMIAMLTAMQVEESDYEDKEKMAKVAVSTMNQVLDKTKQRFSEVADKKMFAKASS